MDIGSVVKALRNGGRLRRARWPTGSWIETDNVFDFEFRTTTIFEMPAQKIWTPGGTDLFATDWEYCDGGSDE